MQTAAHAASASASSSAEAEDSENISEELQREETDTWSPALDDNLSPCPSQGAFYSGGGHCTPPLDAADEAAAEVCLVLPCWSIDLHLYSVNHGTVWQAA